MIQFLIDAFHAIPHLNFHFKWINSSFDIDWRSEYAQSLALVAGVVGAVALLLLLTIIITWICQCCARTDANVKPRRKVRRLSTILFIISIFCFFFLGFCLFGNDQINRGVSSSITSLADVNHQIKITQATGSNLNDISRNASSHIKALEELVYQKGKETPINQTVASEIDALLTALSDSVDTVQSRLGALKEALSEVSFLEQAKLVGERVELERWMLLVIVPSIMLCVLFAGVIAFCRQSKKGAIMFSGVGIFIFCIIWLLLGLVLPATVGLADFCSQGGDFLAAKISQPMLKTLAFYTECDPRPTHDNLPPHLGVANMSEELSAMQGVKMQLDTLLTTAFNSSQDINKASALINDDGTRSLKSIGALEASLACYAYKDDLKTMKNGICGQAMIGASVLTVCLVLLGLFLFTLLLIVSKSWNLFTRLASDYNEVDDDDPFFPRNNDSNIPVDIYGTHVFNPRTRDRTEPSTGTTSATANGQPGESDPLWNRYASAPNATIGRAPNDDNNYGNYQDHYNV